MSGASLLLAQGWWEGHMGWDGGWWIVMVVGMVLVWGLIVLGVVLAVRELARGRDEGRGGGDDAMALLDRRLASGEISPEEYRERRAVLRGESHPPSD
jgi:putative membrane protein